MAREKEIWEEGEKRVALTLTTIESNRDFRSRIIRKTRIKSPTRSDSAGLLLTRSWSLKIYIRNAHLEWQVSSVYPIEWWWTAVFSSTESRLQKRQLSSFIDRRWSRSKVTADIRLMKLLPFPVTIYSHLFSFTSLFSLSWRRVVDERSLHHLSLVLPLIL